jgi:hypothetical protein
VLKIIEKLPPKPHQIGRRGGLAYPYNPTFKVECPECHDVYVTTSPRAQILRTAYCACCSQRCRAAR